MIGLLGGALEQNEPFLVMMVLLGYVGDAGWPWAHNWTESCMIELLGDVWSKMSQFWSPWCFLALLEMLVGTLSIFWAGSCMIELLAGVLEKNEPTLIILVLLCPSGDAGWYSEHILG